MSALVNRFWPPMAAAIALAYLVVMFTTGALPERKQLIRFEASGVMELAPERITRVTVAADGTSEVFVRRAKGWSKEGSAAAVPAPLSKALDLAVKFMHTAKPVRVFKPEDIPDSTPAEYGLDRPRLSITLEDASGVVLEADFGNKGSAGLLRYMRLRGSDDLYMMSGFVGKEWETVANAVGP